MTRVGYVLLAAAVVGSIAFVFFRKYLRHRPTVEEIRQKAEERLSDAIERKEVGPDAGRLKDPGDMSPPFVPPGGIDNSLNGHPISQSPISGNREAVLRETGVDPRNVHMP